MAGKVWSLDASDGELLVRTGVTGPAARMGHRLTIAVDAWSAEVRWNGSEPDAVELTVDVGSLHVLRGQGGLMPLSGPEKALARSHALKSLDAERFPHIRFRADDVRNTGDGYHLTGELEIHGKVRERVIDVRVDDLGDAWRISCEAEVRQSDFDVRPYSLLMGSVKVADDVDVSFTARRPKEIPA